MKKYSPIMWSGVGLVIGLVIAIAAFYRPENMTVNIGEHPEKLVFVGSKDRVPNGGVIFMNEVLQF